MTGKAMCENCAEYSPASNTDDPWSADCYGLNCDTEESERLIDDYFETGLSGCPAFRLRPELRLRERIFRFYYDWRERRYYKLELKADTKGR